MNGKLKRWIQRFNLWLCDHFDHSFSDIDMVIFGIKTNVINQDMSATLKCRRCGKIFVHRDRLDPLA